MSDSKEGPHVEGRTVPSAFQVQLRGTQTVQCNFDRCLDKGARRVNFTAGFDFPTEAYIRAYFMDRQQLISLYDAGIDPYSLYPVEEKNPVSVATVGPVKIAISIESPIGLSERKDIPLPILGVTLEPVWKGHVSELKQLIVYVPEGIKLDLCDHKFEQVSLGAKYAKKGYTAYKLASTDIINERIQRYPYQSFRCAIVSSDLSLIHI